MPSPLAHIGLALALRAGLIPTAPVLGGTSLRPALLTTFAAIAPDLDVLPMLVDPAGLAWHRGPTHSVLGAGVLGLIIGLAGRLRGRELAAVVLSALLHVLMDWTTGVPGAPAHFGVPWAWPFSAEKFISPDPWFGAYHIDGPEGLAAMFSWTAVGIYGKELLTVAVAGLLAWAVRTYR